MVMRFENLQVGDQLIEAPSPYWGRHIPVFWVVTDLWFDPVAGQYSANKGRMAAIRRIGEDGEPFASKRSHTLRGLASQRYRFAGSDVIAMRRARWAGVKSGKIVGLGKGYVIRRRPKIPGGGL